MKTTRSPQTDIGGGAEQAAGGRQHSGLEQRHRGQIEGRLLCFDRIVVSGCITQLQNPASVAAILHNAGLDAFDLKLWAMPLTDEVHQNAKRLAREHGVEIEFVSDCHVRKESLAKAKLAERGPQPGLVCILSAVENCMTCGPRRRGGKTPGAWIKTVRGRCLHYYFYFLDEKLGLLHVRVPTWIPFRLQINFNGHNWLAARLREEGVAFTREDNAFTHMADWSKAQTLSQTLPVAELQRRLEQYAARCCPPAARFGGYGLSLAEVELSLDIAFKSEAALTPVCERACREAMMVTRVADIARYFSKPLSPEAEATCRFNVLAEGVCRVRHQLGSQSLKMYNKGSVLRIEATTRDVTFYRSHREVNKRAGGTEFKVASLRKHLFSLGDLFRLMGDACRRYLDHVSMMEDPQPGKCDLDQITRPKRDARQHSWRGLNFFLAADLDLMLALLRGEGCLSGWTNQRLRAALPGTHSPGQVSRMLRRLREHGLLRRIRGTFKYYLTALGKTALTAALKLKEHLITPVFNSSIQCAA